MDFSNFKFIPQNNKKKGTVSMDDLVEVGIKAEPVWDVKREDKYFTWKKGLLPLEEGFGFTACLTPDETEVYILKTSEQEERKEFVPRFFKGVTSTVTITNDYLRLLCEAAYGADLSEFSLTLVEDNVWLLGPVKEEEVTSEVEVPEFERPASVAAPTQQDVVAGEVDLNEPYNAAAYLADDLDENNAALDNDVAAFDLVNSAV